MVKKTQPEILISRQQAAARAGVKIRTIDYWRHHRKITTYKDGRGRIWIDPQEIDDLMRPQPVSSGV